jgi:hypothetical protein
MDDGSFRDGFWHGGVFSASTLISAFEFLGEMGKGKKSSVYLDKSRGGVNMRAGTGMIGK